MTLLLLFAQGVSDPSISEIGWLPDRGKRTFSKEKFSLREDRVRLNKKIKKVFDDVEADNAKLRR